MPRLVLPTAALLAAALALPAGAADPGIDRVEFGFAGVYKAGEWTPLAITVENGSQLPSSVIVESLTLDADGATLLRKSDPLPVERAGSRAAVRTVLQSGRLGSDLTLRLRASDDSLLAEHRVRYASPSLPEALPKGATVWATAGAFNAADADAVTSTIPLPTGVVAAPLAGGLPSHRLAYAAADLLLVRGDLAPTAPQAEAIRQWVAGGGHLAVALGRHGDAFRAGPLASWFPVEVGEATQLFDLTRIEAYARSNRRLPRARRVDTTRLSGAAQIMLADPNGDMIVRSPYGFGRVTAFAFDLDEPPFSKWEALPDLLARALADPESRATRERQNAPGGVTDLATQLLRAEETPPGAARPTTGRALLLLLLYAAVVGPLDYLLVHRLLRRPALTWLTFPLIVAGAAWWLDRVAVAANEASSRVSRLEFLDVDAATGTSRGRSIVTLFSAASTRAGLTVGPRAESNPAPGEAPPERHLAWIAPPEDTFGGTFRETSRGLFRSGYSVRPPAPAAKVQDLPLLVGSGARFSTIWQRNEAPPIESSLVGRGLLEGRVVHRLPGLVSNYFVVFGDRVYLPREPEWHPGDPIDLASGAFTRQDLGSFLTRARTREVKRKPGEGGESYVLTEGEYDPLSTDLDEIVRMLTFHRAAGGPGYSGLTNVSFAAEDLTPQLALGRAILVGRLDAPISDVEVTPADGPAFESARTSTFVRLLLPTRRGEETPPAPLVSPGAAAPTAPP